MIRSNDVDEQVISVFNLAYGKGYAVDGNWCATRDSANIEQALRDIMHAATEEVLIQKGTIEAMDAGHQDKRNKEPKLSAFIRLRGKPFARLKVSIDLARHPKEGHVMSSFHLTDEDGQAVEGVHTANRHSANIDQALRDIMASATSAVTEQVSHIAAIAEVPGYTPGR